jgi:hypothetical protein
VHILSIGHDLQAGLFSAVLTAFVVESYSSLNQYTAVNVLQQISLQLANSSEPAFAPAPYFTPARSDVRVNVLWFLALVLSLTAALFGLLMKQWLHEYMSWTKISPYEIAVGVRQFRYESLSRWRLHAICASLPWLVQTSLALFLIGLVDFLLHLSTFVGLVIGTAVGACLLAATTTIVLSSAIASCPFRSPVSLFLTRCMTDVRISFIKPLYDILGILVYTILCCMSQIVQKACRWWTESQLSMNASLRTVTEKGSDGLPTYVPNPSFCEAQKLVRQMEVCFKFLP